MRRIVVQEARGIFVELPPTLLALGTGGYVRALLGGLRSRINLDELPRYNARLHSLVGEPGSWRNIDQGDYVGAFTEQPYTVTFYDNEYRTVTIIPSS